MVFGTVSSLLAKISEHSGRDRALYHPGGADNTCARTHLLHPLHSLKRMRLAPESFGAQVPSATVQLQHTALCLKLSSAPDCTFIQPSDQAPQPPRRLPGSSRNCWQVGSSVWRCYDSCLLRRRAVYELHAPGRGGVVKPFHKPWACTAMMFVGMTFCLPLSWALNYLQRRKQLRKTKEVRPPPPPPSFLSPKPGAPNPGTMTRSPASRAWAMLARRRLCRGQSPPSRPCHLCVRQKTASYACTRVPAARTRRRRRRLHMHCK